MSYFTAAEREMFYKLSKFYPVVEPGHEFVKAIMNAFQHSAYSSEINIENAYSWNKQFLKWLPINVGLLGVPDSNIDDWYHFVLIDKKLYTFALLKYS